MMMWWIATALAQSTPTPEQLACDAGNGAACMVLGKAYWSGDGVPKDVFRASQLFRTGCERGDGLACRMLGDAYKTGVGTRLDSAQALTLYTKACELGQSLACRNIGDLYTVGEFGNVDGKTAGVWYQLGCEVGDGQSCSAAGLWVERGDAAKGGNGLALFQKGCELGYHKACALLAERVRRGSDGATKDPLKAAEWYGKGCEEPADPESCREYGGELLKGTLVALDRERGLMMLDRACFMHDSIACRSLAEAQLKQKNWIEALVAGERGCDLGDQAACRAGARARLQLE